MVRPKVYIAKPIHKEIEAYIGKYCDYEIWKGDGNITYDEILNKLEDKDGVLLSRIKIDDNLLNHAPNLKVVSNMSVGYNNFDLKLMKERKVIGTNTAGVLDNTVADLIFGLILATARRIVELDRYVKDKKWIKKDDELILGTDVHHSSLGIIGMGRIGECVARRAKLGFNMEVSYYNRSRKYEVEKNLGIDYMELDTLLKTSNFVVLMTPLTEDTYHLMDVREFQLMKKNAIFINASRGGTVNELALIKALIEKEIRGAGLDVYEVEPINFDNPLLKMQNVITLPHIGSSTEKTRFKMAMVAAKNLVMALQGETPSNVVSELRI